MRQHTRHSAKRVPRLQQQRGRQQRACHAAAVMTASSAKTVTVDLGDRTYPIYIGPGLLNTPELLSDHIRGKRVLIVTNETIAPLYLHRCAQTFVRAWCSA